MMGSLFNFLVRKLFGLTTRDTQSGLKGFERQIAMQVFNRLYTDGFLFDVEIFVRAKKLGIQAEEIPVHLTYGTDESTVKHLQQFIEVLPDLTRIKFLEVTGAYSVPVVGESGKVGDSSEEAYTHRSK
jgi:hypothetical protein